MPDNEKDLQDPNTSNAVVQTGFSVEDVELQSNRLSIPYESRFNLTNMVAMPTIGWFSDFTLWVISYIFIFRLYLLIGTYTDSVVSLTFSLIIISAHIIVYNIVASSKGTGVYIFYRILLAALGFALATRFYWNI